MSRPHELVVEHVAADIVAADRVQIGARDPSVAPRFADADHAVRARLQTEDARVWLADVRRSRALTES